MSEFHWSLGSEEDTQRGERGLGCGMTRSRLRRNSGAAVAMYLLWNATPELLTRRANTPSAASVATNFSTDSTGPDICSTVLDFIIFNYCLYTLSRNPRIGRAIRTVTLSAALWQAGTTSGGQRSTHCSQERPTAAMAPADSFASTMLRPRQYAASTACSAVRVSSAYAQPAETVAESSVSEISIKNTCNEPDIDHSQYVTYFANGVSDDSVRLNADGTQDVNEGDLYGGDRHERHDDVIEDCVRRVREHVQQVDAVRLERRRRALHAGGEHGQPHERAAHARPLRAHAREHEPHGPRRAALHLLRERRGQQTRTRTQWRILRFNVTGQ